MSKQWLDALESCCSPLASQPLDETAAAELAAVFKALADPMRLRLLSLIASRGGNEVCVCELTESFQLTQPTISHHLKTLRRVGLIDCERRGTWVYYWLVPGALARVGGVLGPALSSASSPGPDRVPNT